MCSFQALLKITEKKSQQVYWSQNDWHKKTERLCLFSQNLVDSVELYWKSIALKNRFGNEAFSPQPLKHLYPGETSDACMLSAHTLEDLGMFTYSSLSLPVLLSVLFSPSFSIISVQKVVPKQTSEVVHFKWKLKVGLVQLCAKIFHFNSGNQILANLTQVFIKTAGFRKVHKLHRLHIYTF